MTSITYHFYKEDIGWVVHSNRGDGDKLITKEFMRETLYNAFKTILPADSHGEVDKCIAKFPAYLQFAGLKVNTDNGVIQTTLELYIRKNAIEHATMIVEGTKGTTARIPVTKFSLELPRLDFGEILPDEPIDLQRTELLINNQINGK